MVVIWVLAGVFISFISVCISVLLRFYLGSALFLLAFTGGFEWGLIGIYPRGRLRLGFCCWFTLRVPSRCSTLAGKTTFVLTGRRLQLRVNYWELNIDLRAKLERRVFGSVWLLIWWIWGSFRPPGSVTTDIRPDSTLIRH